MALKLISQDLGSLRAAYDARQAEYQTLRAGEQWAGAILHAGTLVELALKLVICRQLRIKQLPAIFQVHDLELLLYCSGQYDRLFDDTRLQQSFSLIHRRWSMALRYEGAIQTQNDSDEFHRALFDPINGVITFLSQHF